MRARVRRVAMIRAAKARRRTGIPAVPHKRPRLRVTCEACGMLVIDVQPRDAALIRLLGETHHMMRPWSHLALRSTQ